MKKLSIAIATLGLAAAAPAMAQGWYAGLSIGEAKVDASVGDFGLSNGRFDDKDTAFGARIGYELSRHFAVEAGYYHLGKYEFSGNVGTLPVSGEGEARSYNVSMLGILPFSDNFSGYGRIGYGRSQVKGVARAAGFSGYSSEWESEPVYGVGLRWKPRSMNTAFFVEYTRHDDIQVDTAMVGAQVRF